MEEQSALEREKKRKADAMKALEEAAAAADEEHRRKKVAIEQEMENLGRHSFSFLFFLNVSINLCFFARQSLKFS